MQRASTVDVAAGGGHDLVNRFAFPAATLSVIAMNAAAILLPLNGVETDELSARYPTGFTPAGWVFSIWSAIYLGLIGLSVWAVASPGQSRARLAKIRDPYLVSCAANAGWLALWHYEQLLPSVVIMLLLLTSLVTIYVRLRQMPAQSWTEALSIDVPFSLYLGWITTATIANFATWLFDAGAYPFGLQMDEWALVSVMLATALYVGVGVLTRDPVYVAVFTWASLGIVYQTLPTSEPVRLAAAAACGITGALALALLLLRIRNLAARANPASATPGGTGR
jgi:translocator protein